MGARISFAQMSNVQLQNHIRRVSQYSNRVFFTIHAQERMLQRSVSDIQVLDCLRSGLMQRPAQIDEATHLVKCRMEHFGSARNLAVVVGLDDQDPDLLIVTVMTRTR
jgi:hypothetical protein